MAIPSFAEGFDIRQILFSSGRALGGDELRPADIVYRDIAEGSGYFRSLGIFPGDAGNRSQQVNPDGGKPQ